MPWNTDPAHSSITFSGKHMLVATVRGKFNSFQLDANVDESNLARSTGTLTIDAASIDTGIEQRDNHVRSADFLDVENHPKIVFTLKRIEPHSDEYRLIGDLAIRGVTHEVALDAEIEGPLQDPWGGTRIGLSAEGKISRKDWGVNFNAPLSAGGVVVGDTVKIGIDLELVKAA